MRIHSRPNSYPVVGAYREQDVFDLLFFVKWLSPVYTSDRRWMLQVRVIETHVRRPKRQSSPYLNQAVVETIGGDQTCIVGELCKLDWIGQWFRPELFRYIICGI